MTILLLLLLLSLLSLLLLLFLLLFITFAIPLNQMTKDLKPISCSLERPRSVTLPEG